MNMLVNLNELSPRTMQILRRLQEQSGPPDMQLVADQLGMRHQSVKNRLYRERVSSGALSLGHLLTIFEEAEIPSEEYEETCLVCARKTRLEDNIIRDVDAGVFCSASCYDRSLEGFLDKVARENAWIFAPTKVSAGWDSLILTT